MRAAPIGFFFATPGEAWDMTYRIAAITHGHPDGIYPAGVVAGIHVTATAPTATSAI